MIAAAMPDDPNLEIFGITDILCPEETCSPYFKGQVAYHDPSHLNILASWHIGEVLAAEGKGPAVLMSPLPVKTSAEIPTSTN